MMKKTVLIIDDEPVDRFIAERLIRESSREWNIVSFPDAIKALNYLSFRYAHNQTVPEVILLDLLMPITDGLEFLDMFRNEPYAKLFTQTRIIALTISGNRDKHQQALRKGVIKVLSKPLVMNELLQVLQ